ncbi:MAG: hypothetical protein D6800_00135, partial [Candidatus Zixiibacteriota bacterium]
MERTRSMRYLIALLFLCVCAGNVAGYNFIGTIAGENEGDQYGAAMTTVDFNNDGYPDLVVGASAADDAGTSSGKVYLYYGGPAADTVADLVFIGVASSFFGKAVASA